LGAGHSDYPEFAEFLVKEWIDSMSFNPDSIMKTTLKVIDLEKSLNLGSRVSGQRKGHAV
jgi:pyruvate,water dikinase